MCFTQRVRFDTRNQILPTDTILRFISLVVLSILNPQKLQTWRFCFTGVGIVSSLRFISLLTPTSMLCFPQKWSDNERVSWANAINYAHRSCCQQASAAMKLGCVCDYTVPVPALIHQTWLWPRRLSYTKRTSHSPENRLSLSLSLCLSLLPDRTMVSIDLCKNACHSQLPFSSKTYQVSLDDRCLKQQKLGCWKTIYLGYKGVIVSIKLETGDITQHRRAESLFRSWKLLSLSPAVEDNAV